MAIGVSADHEALADAVRGWAERTGLRDSARAALEAPESRPAWFAELGRQGHLGLHLAEEAGGSGAGGLELAVVVEQLGRAFAHGPALPTLFASLVLSKAGGTAAKELLPALADGSTTAAVALGLGSLTAAATADGVSVSGSARPVLGGGLADLLVLGARDGDAEVWFVVDAAQATVTPLAGLDGTRRPAEVALDGVTVPASRLLPGLTEHEVRLLTGVLVAAEATGLAGWALDTATAYAKTREQFGRPIGAFQAVKHRCADMLVRAEQARATAWDGARSLDEPAGPERDLAAGVAIAVATEAAVDNAKDCLQVLGGIGYTWEHDAHVVLKRALSLRALVGDPATWRGSVADLALGGARRRLEVELGDTEAVRAEVRAFVATSPGPAALADSGYLMPHWPEPWGRNASAVEQLVIDQELDAAGIRRPDLVIGAWAAPTLIAHGTQEQQERYVLPTLRGEIVWCQMFSEPGAGSDLASLQTRAERVEGGWRITGQKVWTSMADVADWAILLARTDGTGKGPDRHQGITFFLLDMTTPGVDVRPLRELTGRAAFNEVFLDDVFVPDECVVGEVGHGWKLARTTLANERVAMSAGSPFGRGVEDVLADVGALPFVDPVLRERVGRLVCEAQGQALLAFRTTLRQLSGAEPGPASSVRKLVGMKHQQDAAELRFELLGEEGVTAEGDAGRLGHTMLNTRCLTIAGGTSEVLRNVIGERILGLPRDDAR
jgi:alkylation response protein AidB-like acyl-CoA dehydrogenase